MGKKAKARRRAAPAAPPARAVPMSWAEARGAPAGAPAVGSAGWVRARIPVAERHPDLDEHYRLAQMLSADREFSPRVRREITRKMRHDAVTCGYVDGIGTTIANRVVSEGPVADLKDATLSPECLKAAEDSFNRWLQAVMMTEKLNLGVREENVGSGEAFYYLNENPRLRHEVKLDVTGFEGDQVADPDADGQDPKNVDGVLLDDYGNVRAYRVLEAHPGGADAGGRRGTTKVPADRMFHLARFKRFGQHRATPALMSVIYLVAMRQQFIHNVLRTSRYQASRAGVLFTEGGAGLEPDTGLIPSEALPFDASAINVAPFGWKFQGFDATQPNETLEMFERVILQEIGRAVEMPLLLVTLNASGFNYASAKVNFLDFNRSIRIYRKRVSGQTLHGKFHYWWSVWSRSSVGRFRELRPRFDLPPTARFMYLGGFEFLDLQKELPALITGVREGIFAIEDVWGLLGYDPDNQKVKVEASLAWLSGVGLGSATTATPAAPPDPDRIDDLERKLDETAAAVEAVPKGGLK